MDLIKITDLTNQLGISSRSLRYYEQIGLIQSIRSDIEKYRYYNEENIERLKQIMVLRKMQIPIKDIIRIYENENMSTVVEVFVERINAIDEEANALTELKRIVSEFLQTMIQNGITKISAIPLLYEEMDKKLDVLREHKSVSYDELSTVSEKLLKSPEIRIVSLPAMRVITSYNGKGESLVDEFWTWVHLNGFIPGSPGAHEQFEYQDEKNQSVIMLSIPEDYINNSDFYDKTFDGGMFAAASVYADEDLEAFHRAMVRYFDGSLFYEIDYSHSGKQQHETLIETLISPDSTRELLDIFIPIKRRMPEAKHFYNITSVNILDNVTIEEIEQANPVLWEYKIPLDKLVPVYKEGYESVFLEFMPNGDLHFIPYSSTRYLSTDISARLPFRFDIEFMIKDRHNTKNYLMTKNHLMRIFHDDNQYTVNIPNRLNPKKKNGMMEFMQPIFKDWYHADEAGIINTNEYNHVSWIMGEKYFTLIINGEVRYCAVNFPYMLSDFGLLQEHPIFIGSNGDALFIRSVTVSQLKYTPKIKIKKENFNMVTKQSNNILPNIRVINRGDRGENHEFCGAAAYFMECIGETAFGEFTGDKNERLWFFEGLTADVLTQVFSYTGHQGWARSDYLYSKEFIVGIFDKCGYASTFITSEEFNSNREMYVQTIMAYIDKGAPVIIHEFPYEGECKIVCGYEDYGKTLLFLNGSNTQEINKLTVDGNLKYSWVFVGETKQDINIAEMYRNMIFNLPDVFSQRSDTYCFGANAFLAWADEIEKGKLNLGGPYDLGLLTTCAVVNNVLDKVVDLNPDMKWVENIKACYGKNGDIWNQAMDVFNDNSLDNAVKFSQVAEFVRKMGIQMNKAIKIIQENKVAYNK